MPGMPISKRVSEFGDERSEKIYFNLAGGQEEEVVEEEEAAIVFLCCLDVIIYHFPFLTILLLLSLLMLLLLESHTRSLRDNGEIGTTTSPPGFSGTSKHDQFALAHGLARQGE